MTQIDDTTACWLAEDAAVPTLGHVDDRASRGADAAPAGRWRSSGSSGSARPPAEWIYRNLTPWRIEYRLEPDDQAPVLTIPPLGETRVSHVDCAAWNTRALRQRGQLEIVPAPGDMSERLASLVLLLGIVGVALTSLIWTIVGGTDAVPVRAMCALLVLVTAVSLVASCVGETVHERRYRRYRDAWRGDRCENSTQGLNIDRAEDRHDGVTSQIGRRVAEAIVLFGSLAIGVAGPAFAIYHTSQLRDVLPFDLAALFRLEDPFAGATDAARDSMATWQLLVGHAAQWVLVSVAALVPAAMYFQFDRERLAAIQGRWVRQVFRLDPTMRSLGDVQAKYGAHMESSFGLLAPGSRTRHRRGRRSPVVVATILITIGWIVLAIGAQVPELVIEDGRYVWPDGSFPVVDFFVPQGTALAFAFLGAYLFTIFHIVRAYQRRDLVPKTYNTIVVRFLAAYILTLAAEAMLPGDVDDRTVIAFAFFAGFLPQSALVRLREVFTDSRERRRVEVLDEKAPLTELEGIDLYDRTRLAEEGVNNVHALAHADIVELMSSTRISADRLVDWTDQAILFLRVGGDHMGEHAETGHDIAAASDPAEARPTSGRAHVDALSMAHANMRHLRRFGIRTASDLLQIYEAAVERGEQEAAAAVGHTNDETSTTAVRRAVQREVDQLRRALSRDGMAPDDSGYLPIQGMLDTLPDEEWFTQIRNWRCSEFGACESWCWYIDGHWPYPKLPATVPEQVRHIEQRQRQRMFAMQGPCAGQEQAPLLPMAQTRSVL
jgi:hypothetical protein